MEVFYKIIQYFSVIQMFRFYNTKFCVWVWLQAVWTGSMTGSIWSHGIFYNINYIKSGQLLLFHIKPQVMLQQGSVIMNNVDGMMQPLKVIILQHLFEVRVDLFCIILSIEKPIRIYSSNYKGQNFITNKRNSISAWDWCSNITQFKFNWFVA